MIKIWKNCCYLFLITICSALDSKNICVEITSENFDLKQFAHENVEPDSLLRSSLKFYLVNEVKDILSCCQNCCDDEECQSIFFHENNCFLTRCSFILDKPNLCPSGFLIGTNESLYSSNWTWFGVKDITNDEPGTILKQFQDKRSNLVENEATAPLSYTDQYESSTIHTNFYDSTFPLPAQFTHSSPSATQADDHMLPTEPSLLSMSKSIMWTVSAGPPIVSRMPENNFTLQAIISPEPPDDEKALFSYQWVMVSSPPSVESGHMDNMSSPSLKLTTLHEGSYILKVIVTRGSQSNEAYVNVTLLPALKKNEPPVAKIMPSSQKLNQQNDLVLDGSESFDDGGIVSYKWELVSGPATASFPLETTFNQSVFKFKRPLTPGLYKFRLTVVDANGASDETDATVDVLKELDYPPKANAGSNQILYLPTNYVTLLGNESYDDRSIVSYEWTKVSNNLVNDMTGARTPFLQLSNLQVGDYTFTLTVTDASNQVDKAEVHVIVKPAQNHPPVANAGMNKTLFLPLAAVDLDASNSTDDNKIISYHWTILDGPDRPRIENANQSKAQLLNPAVGVYILRLDVADEMKLKATSNVYITIKQNQNVPPVANAGGNIVVELNQGDVVIINGSSSHDDRGISKYLWIRDNKSPAAGVPLKNSDHSPVLRLVNLVKGHYIWTLEVFDSEGLSNKDQMVLTVKKDPKEDLLVRLVLGVESEKFTGLYKEALQSHLEDLVKKNFGDSTSRVTLTKLGQDPITGRTVIDFYVESFIQEQWKPHLGDEIENILKNELSTGFSFTLEFPIVNIFSVVCHRNCSGHGKCDQITRTCICDTFWTSNWFKANYGSKETNCDWSILYVMIVILILVIIVILILWYAAYSINRRLKRKCRPGRSQVSVRKRHHRYTLLDETSNGIKTNGDASNRQRNFYSDKGLPLSKIIDDQSDSSTSSEDMIFSRSNNDNQLRTVHRGGPNNKPEKKSRPDDEQDWLQSPREDVIGRFS